MAAAMIAADPDSVEFPGSGFGIRLPTRSLPRDERTDLFDAPRVEHVFGLNPATTCRANAEPHLARQPFGPVAVAVDGDGDTSCRGTARDRAIHVQMSGRTVDFHRRSGFRRCLKQRAKVQIEAGEARR